MLIKVASPDSNSKKLISANDLQSLKEKAQEKFGYLIEKFETEKDGFEIEDDDTLHALLEKNSEMILIASPTKSAFSKKISSVRVSYYGSPTPISFTAESLISLKEKAENEFNIIIDRFERKEDGAEIDDEETYMELIKIYKDSLWLVAVCVDENKYADYKATSFLTADSNDEDDESNYFLEEYKEMEKKIQELKQKNEAAITSINKNTASNQINLKKSTLPTIVQEQKQSKINSVGFAAATTTMTNKNMKTAILKKKLNELKKELRKEEEKMQTKLEETMLEEEINRMSIAVQELKSNELKSVVLTSSTSTTMNTVSIDEKLNDLREQLKKAETEEKDQAKLKKLEEINRMSTAIQEIKKSELKSVTISPTNMNTSVIDKKLNDMQEQLKKKEEENQAKLKKLEEVNRISTAVQDLKSEKERLEKEIARAAMSSIATKQANKTDIEKLEAKKIELELKRMKIGKIFDDLKQAEKVDICFMLDCTGSMGSYITEAKNVIHGIINKLGKTFTDFKLRASFVGYRDHSDGLSRVSVLSFTDQIDMFKSFVSSMSATGGADACEDVFGGLEEVNNLEWFYMTRVLFHIGDAPCHGLRFHNGVGDDYPEGDPRGLNITDLVKGLVNKSISYYFAQVNDITAKMIEEFDRELLAVNGNKINVLNLSSTNGLSELVTKSIATAIFESKSMSMHTSRTFNSSTGKYLSSKRLKKFGEILPLDWSPHTMKKYTADLYEFKYDGRLNEFKIKSIESKKKNVEILISEKPFAKGALRYAFAGLLNGSKKSVLKCSMFNDPEHNTMKYHKDLIENQVVAAFLARSFFREVETEKSIRFLDVNLIHIVEKGFFYSIEDFVEGSFQKWINNAGQINEEIYSCTLDTFSHWTYQATCEYLIVTDLQGMIVDNKEYILTDPAITSPEGFDRFGNTNLLIKGVQKFFETHQCNHLCKHLKLKKHKYQEKPDRVYSPLMTKMR